jgi:hypothetical protein
MLGYCCHRRIWYRSWDFIFNSVFWQFHFGQLMVLYEDYEKAGFFMLPTGKR